MHMAVGPHINASVFQDIRTGVEGTFKLSFSFSAREGGKPEEMM